MCMESRWSRGVRRSMEEIEAVKAAVCRLNKHKSHACDGLSI